MRGLVTGGGAPASGRLAKVASRCVAPLALAGACMAWANAADLPAPGSDARSIMERSNLAYYYPGRDMRVKVTLELGPAQESKRLRVMTVLRLNEAPGGDQKYFLYFHQPGDARRMSCMTWKHVGGPDDRWMYVPLSGHVVRVRASERSSFLGSEFMREEFSGRDVDADDHRFVRSERLGGRDCYVIESLPKESAEFLRFTSWIDMATYLPLRQEFWNLRGERARVFVAGRIEEIASHGNPTRTYPTAMERTMTNASGRWSKVTLDSVSYDVGLQDGDFSERHLRTPITEWLP